MMRVFTSFSEMTYRSFLICLLVNFPTFIYIQLVWAKLKFLSFSVTCLGFEIKQMISVLRYLIFEIKKWYFKCVLHSFDTLIVVMLKGDAFWMCFYCFTHSLCFCSKLMHFKGVWHYLPMLKRVHWLNEICLQYFMFIINYMHQILLLHNVIHNRILWSFS